MKFNKEFMSLLEEKIEEFKICLVDLRNIIGKYIEEERGVIFGNDKYFEFFKGLGIVEDSPFQRSDNQNVFLLNPTAYKTHKLLIYTLEES